MQILVPFAHTPTWPKLPAEQSNCCVTTIHNVSCCTCLSSGITRFMCDGTLRRAELCNSSSSYAILHPARARQNFAFQKAMRTCTQQIKKKNQKLKLINPQNFWRDLSIVWNVQVKWAMQIFYHDNLLVGSYRSLLSYKVQAWYQISQIICWIY